MDIVPGHHQGFLSLIPDPEFRSDEDEFFARQAVQIAIDREEEEDQGPPLGHTTNPAFISETEAEAEYRWEHYDWPNLLGADGGAEDTLFKDQQLPLTRKHRLQKCQWLNQVLLTKCNSDFDFKLSSWKAKHPNHTALELRNIEQVYRSIRDSFIERNWLDEEYYHLWDTFSEISPTSYHWNWDLNLYDLNNY